MTWDVGDFSPVGCSLDRVDGGVVLTSIGEEAMAVTEDPGTIEGVLGHRFLVIDATNRSRWNTALTLGFWSADAPIDRPDVVVLLGLFPELPTRLTFDLDRLDGERLFLDRTPGKLKTLVRGAGVDRGAVRRFGLGVSRSAAGSEIIIRGVYGVDSEPEYPLPSEAFVDRWGQWAKRDWEGKTDTIEQIAREFADSDTLPPETDPPSRSGGVGRAQPSPRFAATGFFRVDHDGVRQVLVDPNGDRFYSLGVDVVGESIPARVDGIEPLFAWLPPRDGEFAEFYATGHDRSSNAVHFDFHGANLKRALGDEWFARWAEVTERRLVGWGFNTIGNWSSRRAIASMSLPYVLPLSGSVETTKTIFRDFPDVFDDEYLRVCADHAKQLDAVCGDRGLVGYFIMNEPQWAFVDDLNIAEKLLANPAEFASKEALLRFLSQRYGGDARRLADAWSLSDISSFSDLRRPIQHAAGLSDASKRDLRDFSAILVERFAQVPCDAARRVDGDHLNLGMRYAWISQDALYRTAPYFDVFSINSYSKSPRESIDRIGERTGKPVLIGEFHHGALDVGLPANGIRGVQTQAERGIAYRHYVETAAASPYAVGTHYFTLNDQPVLGRFDGENFQIGLVDICGHPYGDFVSRVAATNRAIGEVLDGEREPNEEYPKEVTVGF